MIEYGTIWMNASNQLTQHTHRERKKGKMNGKYIRLISRYINEKKNFIIFYLTYWLLFHRFRLMR